MQHCCFPLLSMGQLYVLQAGFGSEEQRLLQTPDLVVRLISYLLKNAPTVGVFVCSILWEFLIQTSFDFVGKNTLTYWYRGTFPLFIVKRNSIRPLSIN